MAILAHNCSSICHFTSTHTLIFDNQKAVTHMHQINCCLACYAASEHSGGLSCNHAQPSRSVVIVNILSVPTNYELPIYSNHQCTPFYCNPNNKLYTVKPCVPSCQICGHCRHRCCYVGCFAKVEIRKTPRCAVERDWSASGFTRRALSRMLVGSQSQSRFDSGCLEVDSCCKPILCVLEGIRPSRWRRLASSHRNIAEALRLLRLLYRMPLSEPLVLFIASNQRVLV
jgi:hypothetical protein